MERSGSLVVKYLICVPLRTESDKTYQYRNRIPPLLRKSPVLVAIQHPDKSTTLNFISAFGQPHNVKTYQAIGSGSPYAQIFLKKHLNNGMVMEKAAELGFFIVKYIEDSKLNFTVGGEPMIWFIPDDERDEKGNKIDYILKKSYW